MSPPPIASPPVPWAAGTLIGGRYRLTARIGAGAMGQVWRAEHVTLGTSVAVKLVDAQTRPNPHEILARFLREARAAARLQSAHVVQILDHGTEGSVAYMAMELLQGEDLGARLDRAGRLAPIDVARVIGEIAKAIGKAHELGIVHRDLKPQNVFLAAVEGREVVKVLDFGIAKVMGGAPDFVQTSVGTVIGTPAYMSPEQVLGRAVDWRSDLWQLAVIAFECAVGARPFSGGTLGELFMKICSAPVPVPSQLVGLPGAGPGPAEAFDGWIARATQRDPAARFQSAREMVEALWAALVPDVGTRAALADGSWIALPAAPPPGDAARRDLASELGTNRSSAWSSGGRAQSKPTGRTLVITGLAAAALSAALSVSLVAWRRAPAAPDAGASVEPPRPAPEPPPAVDPAPPAPASAAPADAAAPEPSASEQPPAPSASADAGAAPPKKPARRRYEEELGI